MTQMPAPVAPAVKAPQAPLRLRLATAQAGLAPRAGTTPQTVVFTHIPKTAGTTLDNIMHAAALTRGAVWRRVRGAIYSPLPDALTQFESWDRDQLATLDYLTGHLPYGIHARLPRSCLYVTLLREPTAQLLSYFRFGVERGLWTRETPVDELMRAGHLIDNPQTRQIAGHRDRGGECTPETLATAIANLSAYAVVGITERFDALLKALIALLGWPDVAYTRHQVGSLPVDPGLSERIAAAAERYYALDRVLYAAAARHPEPWSADPVASAGARQRSVLVVAPPIRVAGRRYGLLSAADFDNVLCSDVRKRGGSVDVV